MVLERFRKERYEYGGMVEAKKTAHDRAKDTISFTGLLQSGMNHKCDSKVRFAILFWYPAVSSWITREPRIPQTHKS
jgi:hypothetical protein